MNPYTIVAALLVLIATAFGGAHVGKRLENQKWQAEKLQMQAAQSAKLGEEFLRYADLVSLSETQARKASEIHEQALDNLRTKYDDDVAAVKRAGGLRIPSSVCPASGTTPAQAAGASRPDEAPASSIRLPERIENDLFAFAFRADQVTEQCRALQGWVRANGFYGEAP